MTMTRGELMGLAFLIPMYTAASVNAQTITLLTEPDALSIVVLRIEVTDLSDDRGVYLDLKSSNDADYHEIYLFSSDYSEVSGKRFSDPVDGKRVLIVPVFVSGVKTWEHGKHIFDSSGVYWLRLRSYQYDTPRGPAKERILFERRVEFGEPNEANLDYFAAARQENVWSTFGIAREYAEGLTSINGNILGLIVASTCVQSTLRKVDPRSGNAEFAQWADTMYDLAFAVSDSSYAPYIAYFAAHCLLEPRNDSSLEETYGFALPDKRIVEVDFFKRASKALAFTVERGDPYIKPFAMCHLAFMKARAADFAGAHELIQRVKKESNTSRKIAELADQVERYTAKLRARRVK